MAANVRVPVEELLDALDTLAEDSAIRGAMPGAALDQPTLRAVR